MSSEGVGMGEMHGFQDEDVDAVLEGRTAAGPSDVVDFVSGLRHAFAAEATPQPTEALAELFARGLPGNAPAPVAETPRRNRVFAPINRLGTAAKAAIAAVVLVGASSGLAAADLLPQPVDDTVSSVVPFVATDSDDDDGTADQGPGDAPGTPGSDDLEDTTDDSDDTGDRDDADENDDSDDNSGPGSDDSDDDDAGDDNSGPSENSGPGNVNSGSGSDDDDDDDSPTSTPTTIDDDDDDSTATTIDDDDSTVTTIDDDDSTVTTIDDDSGSDDGGSGDSEDNSGSGSDSSGSGSDDD